MIAIQEELNTVDGLFKNPTLALLIGSTYILRYFYK